MSNKLNIRFADKSTCSPLFELQVDKENTIFKLKAFADEYLANNEDFCPFLYFDKWFCEGKIGDRTRTHSLTLEQFGLQDESIVYLEGPLFEEKEAHIGRALAMIRAEATQFNAQQAQQVTNLTGEVI